MSDIPKYALKHVSKGKFDIKVFIHDLPNGTGSVPCWTYVTDGFLKLGQKEFVFTLRRKLNEKESNPPWDIVGILEAIYGCTEKKTLVDVGDVSCFNSEEPGFLGLLGMWGLAYARPQWLEGVAMPSFDSCLMAILLVPGETEFAYKFGSYRTLSRLGRKAFYFPHPPWSDRSRESTITVEDTENSILTKVTLVRLRHSYFTLPTKKLKLDTHAGDVRETGTPRGIVNLFIHPEDVAMLKELLEFSVKQPGIPIGLVVLPSPEAGIHRVWTHDTQESSMITSSCGDAAGVTGGFMTFGYDEFTPENGCFFEDGIIYTLTSSKWSHMRTQLMQCNDVSYSPAGTGGLGLSVRFIGRADKPWWKLW